MGRHEWRGLLLACVGACLVAAPASASTVRLSNEQTQTQWAHPAQKAQVHATPDPGSSVIAHLRTRTEDKRPEIYVALEQQSDAAGQPWVHVRLPMRPNGRIGWVPRSALGTLHVIHTQLVIDRRALRATLFSGGRAVWRAGVGVGKRGLATPTGSFYVRERLPGGGGAYGPVAFGTSAYSPRLTDWPGGGVVGIHGTNQPDLVPGRPSHGCVRLRNRDILRLARLMPLGTPVLIR